MPIRVTLTIAFALATLGVAVAQPSPQDEARRLYAEGKAYYDRGAYADAVVAWKASYRVAQAPRLLWNIGQAYRQAGDCPHALHFYARYQQADAAPSNAAELGQALALCKDAQPSTDDGEVVPAPPVSPPVSLPVSSPATPRITPPASADIAPTIARTTTPSPPPRGRSLRRTAGLVAVGGGVLGGAAGVYFAMRAADLAGDIEHGGGEWDAPAQARDADGRRAQRAAIGLGAASAVALSAGALLWWSGRSREARPRVGIALTTHAAAVELSCAF